MFEDVEAPTIIPEIWSFPQVQYGNWRGLLKLKDDDIREYAEKLAQEEAQGVQTSNKRKLKSIAGSSKASSSKASSSKASSSKSKKKGLTLDDIITFETIEPENHVVILCLEPDKWALKIPNTQPAKYVWIAKAHTCDILKSGIRANFNGKFMFNATKELDKPLQLDNKSQTIQIKETAIIKVYLDEELTLDDSDIKEISDWVNIHT